MTLLLFDVDGTLVYSERRDSRCFADVYESIYGKVFPSIDWRSYPHVTDTSILSTVIHQHFQRFPDEEEILSFQEIYMEALLECRRLNPAHSLEVPGAGKAIERLLKDDRFELGVATGGWAGSARLKLEHVGIPVSTIPIQGADGVHTREEIIEGLVAEFSKTSTTFNRIVYVGDALWDVHTMRNLQMPFVGMRWRGDTHMLQEAGARHVLSNYLNYQDFLDIVEQAEPPEL